MDTRLLEYYNQELQYIREMGAEFAEAYPRIAARLGIDGIECADPYVERLIESFAFLAARVQLKLDARHPEFTQHLLEMIYPHFLAPVPSCAVVELVPTPEESGLKEGYRVERGRALRTELATGDRTTCEFRTAQDTVLWPLQVTEARYIVGTSAFATPGLRLDSRVRGALRLGLSATQGAALRDLAVDSLTFYIYATPDLAGRIYEQVLANCIGVLVKSPQAGRGPILLPARAVRAVGFEDSEAMLPVGHRSFQGYRLLQEYFAFADRFLFFSVAGLGEAFRAAAGGDVELLLLFDRSVPDFENALDAGQFRLNCTPIVNLFPRTLDRIHVSTSDTELHVVPDLSRPMDFEVFSVDRVLGFGSGGESIAEILPFYSTGHRTIADDARAYYTIQRRPRLASQKQRRTGARTNYLGSECFLSLVDSQHRDITGEIRQLEAEAHCTNRDLPIGLSFGKSRLEFSVEGGAPVQTVRCLAGPTTPRASPAFGDTAWKLIGQLSLNYLSLVDTDEEKGAEMLRHLLGLYSDANDPVAHRQVDGVRRVSYRPVVRRIPGGGPITYGRGLQLDLTLDDMSFEGVGTLRLGTVLERFFSRYVSLNSFVETRLLSVERGEVKRWPVRTGTRQTL
jgi:type VI secretion system protein ImpG